MLLKNLSRLQPVVTEEGIAVPRTEFDYKPLLLIPLLALIGMVLVRDTSTWVTLTIAGIGMGFIIFLSASGLTLVFGLMGIMNFGHSIFITLGAIIGGMMFLPTVLPLVACWCRADSIALNLLAITVAGIIAMAASALIGLVFERLFVRKAYGQSLTTQIMLTIGGMIITEQLTVMFLGKGMIINKPPSLSGLLMIGDVGIEKYRLMTAVVGILVYITMMLVLNKTKLGLLVRAAIEQREIVEAMGYKTKFLFIGFFVAGTALAALGGLFYGMFQTLVGIKLGSSLMIPIFMVLIIGGLGSITGACVAAVLIGMLNNYVGFAFPPVTAFSMIFLMIAVGLWRPQGLYPVNKGSLG
ncbi:MAG: branched-chain amino acid ABC transporter permease [Burkholderiales bacterium]|nr:branched-chain amino acid ABC transporter permease [Burkholderiales bacterium]